MAREKKFDKMGKMVQRKVQRWRLLKPKLVLMQKYAFVLLCVWVCTLFIETVIETAIYQQLHFPQRPQCCSCIYKLFKMHEKMEWGGGKGQQGNNLKIKRVTAALCISF